MLHLTDEGKDRGETAGLRQLGGLEEKLNIKFQVPQLSFCCPLLHQMT